ncbi:MAG: hypothetical protein ACMXX7_01100 [Candidatus Woesearchaeota archaeon]
MSNEKVLTDFIGDYKLDRKDGISIVSAKDLSQLKSAGYTSEDLFDHLSKHYQSLLHGSRTEISDNCLKQNGAGKVYGSDLAAIALMRAIVSNRGLEYPGLQYPYFIDEKNPLEVIIHGINDNTIGQEGFIYVLNQREGFENNPKGSWQYVKTGQDVPIAAKIAVEKSDFTYPIFDLTNNRKIQ